MEKNDSLLEKNSFYQYQKDFVTRQYLMADLQKEKLETKIKGEQLDFEPKVNKITKFIMESDPDRAEEKLEDKIERLAKKDFEKREIVRELVSKAYYDKFTFQPEINGVSKIIGKNNNFESLANNKENEMHKKALQEAKFFH